MTDLEAITRLTVAMILGCIIGLERYVDGKTAGMRTLGLVALGSALFVTSSIGFGVGSFDPSRVAAQVVVGVGFLGAGIVLQTRRGPQNLTTAAAVWVTAAIGMAAGIGWWATAIGGTVLAFIALRILEPLEKKYIPRKEPPEHEPLHERVIHHHLSGSPRQPTPKAPVEDID